MFKIIYLYFTKVFYWRKDLFSLILTLVLNLKMNDNFLFMKVR